MANPTPSPANRLALALCRAIAKDLGGEASPCHAPCSECRQQSAAVAAELDQILRERLGGASQVAHWRLDGVGHG